LEASSRRLDGKGLAFVRRALPWLALSWALDGLGTALPDALALALGLPSLALALVPIVLSLDL
jgi:hypothetical protein